MTTEEFEAKGVDPSIMIDEKSGFHSELFFNEETKEYIIAYRGSELEGNDWNTNIAQATGNIGAQYEKVKEQLVELKLIVDSEGATLTATGHSLGGGMTLATAATGLVDRAVAFNPAGLHVNTIEFMKDVDETTAQATARIDNITTSYISRGDLLNNMQDLLDFAVPTAMGTRVVVEGGGTHGIGAVVEAFNGQQRIV